MFSKTLKASLVSVALSALLASATPALELSVSGENALISELSVLIEYRREQGGHRCVQLEGHHDPQEHRR
jgi:hypothetical protein